MVAGIARAARVDRMAVTLTKKDFTFPQTEKPELQHSKIEFGMPGFREQLLAAH